MNILLGAYACEPNNGSEPEVGWQMANEIARAMPEDKIYVITKSNNKPVIEKEHYPANLKFYYYGIPQWLSFWKKGGRGIRTYYYFWMIGAARFMKAQNIKFDIIHHITFVNDWLPSFFLLLKNKQNKFIWGPIGSNDPISNIFLDGRKRIRVEKIKIISRYLFRLINPSFHFCKRRSDCIIGINANVRKKLALGQNQHFIDESAIGVSKSVIEQLSFSSRPSNKFLVISVGRLVYIKNFKLTVLVFAKFLKNNPSSNACLQIIGEGHDRELLEKLVKALGIVRQVEFIGKVSLSKVQEYLSNASVFLFPTLENAGFVTLEAMSHKLPVLAMDYGGPQQFVQSFKKEQLVSAYEPYDQITETLANNLEKFYLDRKLRKEIGERNHKDVLENFTWEAKAQRMKKLYKELVNET
ncbi:glycosyltransferase [Francisellaceae bacterium]|nr:glycosyltransferase [Francisellaceae bacterium]